MFKSLVSAIERACICYADFDDAYSMVEEARAMGIIDQQQFDLLTGWIIGNMIHQDKEVAVMK